MCPSLAPTSCCLSTKCPSGRRVRLLPKGTQGSLLPSPVAFSADKGRWGREGYLGKEWECGKQGAKTLRLGLGGGGPVF